MKIKKPVITFSKVSKEVVSWHQKIQNEIKKLPSQNINLDVQFQDSSQFKPLNITHKMALKIFHQNIGKGFGPIQMEIPEPRVRLIHMPVINLSLSSMT